MPFRAPAKDFARMRALTKISPARGVGLSFKWPRGAGNWIMSRLDDRRLAAKDGDFVSGPAAQRANVIAALDLGASKITCLLMTPEGQRQADRTVRVSGVAPLQSAGLRSGLIVDMDQAAYAIGRAVERAERQAGVAVSGVTVSTAAGQLASHRVAVSVSLGAHPINNADLSRAISAALAEARYAGRSVIHTLPIRWSVDELVGIQDPRNMIGKALGLEMLVVTMAESAFMTLRQCVELAHLNFEGVIAAPYAAGLAALEDDEMDLGCICIDMGGGSTSVAVFGGGTLLHVDSLHVGGSHVTADLARGLQTTTAGAERIKVLHGSAIASTHEDRETIECPPRGNDRSMGNIVVPRTLLKSIIAARVEETFELLRERLNASGAPIEPSANIVLTGGASELAGVREVAERVFDRQVRLGRPRRAPHLADVATGPGFCAAVGVLQRAVYGPRECVPSRILATGRVGPRDAPQTGGGLGLRLMSWLRQNF